MKKDIKICLARIYYPVSTLGPGNRVGIWVCGCRRKCDGCISPELQSYDISREVTITEIVEMIQLVKEPIDGFTISGGEPFYKPDALSAMLKELAKINDDILIYTGYTLEELRAFNNPYVETSLELCAALIDGPYIKQLNDNIGIRGSSNQRCWVFRYSQKYYGLDIMDRQLQTIVYGNKILTIGIPKGDSK